MTLKSGYKKISKVTRYTGLTQIDCNLNTAKGDYFKRRFLKFNYLF